MSSKSIDDLAGRENRNRERNSYMRYIKPQILTASRAASTIKGGKEASLHQDNQAEQYMVTIPAYQADE
jgi:hypothetical protein